MHEQRTRRRCAKASLLIAPHYGINDRQPTRKLINSATNIMTLQKQTHQPTATPPIKQPIMITPPIQQQQEPSTIIEPPKKKRFYLC